MKNILSSLFGSDSNSETSEQKNSGSETTATNTTTSSQANQGQARRTTATPFDKADYKFDLSSSQHAYHHEADEDFDYENSLKNPEYFTDAMQSLWTVQDLIRWVYTYMSRNNVYFGHGYDNAWDEARVIVFNRLHLPYETDQAYLLNSKLTEYEKKEIIQLVKQRVHDRVPLAYLINSARFLNRDYYVDERVIIPRSPIGELIEGGFIEVLPALPHAILDLCTGSGVLAIALAERFPEAQVDGIDISPDAIDVCNINLELTNNPSLAERMAFIESDLFEALPEEMKYDLIVSNPPYVDEYDLSTMPAEFHHEPAISLGSGFDGLELTSRILVEAPKHLNPNGTLVVEVGNSRYALEEALPNVPFKWIEFERGGHGVFALSLDQLNAHAEEFKAFMDEKIAARKVAEQTAEQEADLPQETEASSSADTEQGQ